MYYCRKKNTLYIKKATTYLDLVSLGKTDKEIADMMKEQANEMYDKICKDDNK